jgi:hypothetical protein
MTEAPTVFVVTIRAVAGPANAVPDGRGYDLLVFARALDEAAATRVALAGVAQLGWVEARARRCGEITRPGALPKDFAPAYGRAVESGCAVIVYDEP